MVMECTKCHWMGIDLVPDYENNTAKCPKCGAVFASVPAANAVTGIPKAERDRITSEAKSFRGR